MKPNHAPEPTQSAPPFSPFGIPIHYANVPAWFSFLLKPTMKAFILSLGLALGCVSCDWLGGGVAGAGSDSIWVRDAAKNYHGYQDTSITLTREAVSNPDVQQTFEKMLDGFPEHILIDQDTNSSLGEFQISFNKQHLSVRQKGQLLFEEQVPAAFYSEDLQVGRFQMRSHDLLIFITKSKASTGLYFVGLYSITGQRLLTKTVSVGELWDCKESTDELLFVCPTQRLHITVQQLDFRR